MSRKKVLLGHLNSNGDCLFATVIARQIKEVDFPNCHLTWAVNSKCKQSVLLNPYVDEVWEIPTRNSLTATDEWEAFVREVEERKEKGDFDFVFLTQIMGDNYLNYDGGIRSSTYNNYPNKITVSHQPVIRLSQEEIENVRRFAEKNQLSKYKQVILVECGPDSFESALNIKTASGLAQAMTLENKDIAFILSSNKQIEPSSPNIIDGSCLSFRENAELTKYCTLFIGCASGISWIAMTDWAKRLNMILVINQDHPVMPSIVYDQEYLTLPTGHIIEIKNNRDSMETVKKCLNAVLTSGFSVAKKSFHEKIKLKHSHYLKPQLETHLGRLDFKNAFLSVLRHVKRNGIQIIFTPYFLNTVWNLQLRALNKGLETVGLKKKEALLSRHKR